MVQLETPVSLSEKLQAAEAGKLAAEMTLSNIATDIELWRCTDGNQGQTIVLLNQIAEMANDCSLTAARELIADVQKWREVASSYPTDEEADELHKAFGGPAECTTFGPAAIERMAERNERRKNDPDFVLPLSEYKALKSQAETLYAELDAIKLHLDNYSYTPEPLWRRIESLTMETQGLRTRLAESEALVERWRHQANEWADCATNGYQWLMIVRDGITPVGVAIERMLNEIQYRRSQSPGVGLTPADALADYRDAVIESVAKWAENLSKMDGDCTLTPSEIRAMKAPEKGGTR